MKNNSVQIGDQCPVFTLTDQHGNLFNLSTVLGKKNVVIYFYPKDETPGCTKEACSFRDSYSSFLDFNCEVIGISSDSTSSHKRFAERHQLPFILLSDEKKTVRKQFNVPPSLFGLLPGRVTYIVDKQGVIRGIFNSQTDPVGHIKKALEIIQTL
jgi:peroxiredoxin Q/BCP